MNFLEKCSSKVKRAARFFIGAGALIILLPALSGGPSAAEKNEVIIKGSHKEVKVIGGMVFVYIEGGEYMMGSPDDSGYGNERPRHNITISPFLMGKFEVTQAQYRELTGKNPSGFPGENRPVEQVSWDDAEEFARRFSAKHGVRARLPYEAEWEYACRAGTATRYYWGNEVDGSYCWYNVNSNDETHPVGWKIPNKWGLHDMLGNVYEWCMDYYSDTYYGDTVKINPPGPRKGTSRVARGGSWHNDDYNVRTAFRVPFRPVTKDFYHGFRLVIPVLKQD